MKSPKAADVARCFKDEDKQFWRRLAEDSLNLTASADETDRRRIVGKCRAIRSYPDEARKKSTDQRL